MCTCMYACTRPCWTECVYACVCVSACVIYACDDVCGASRIRMHGVCMHMGIYVRTQVYTYVMHVCMY